jgi:hypothetical protein
LDSADSHRDRNGRFTAGNPGGPGGSRPRRGVLRDALEGAITPDHVAGLVRKLTMTGLGGNVTAAKVALDHTCGRAPAAHVDVASPHIALPKLLSAADCTAAIDVIIAAMTAGMVDLPTAKFLLDAVERRRKAIETLEHEQRLTDLEQAASNVDFGRR